MNPETEQNINQAIDWLQKTGGQIQDFAVEQAPLYCREVVQWELWNNGAWIAVSLLSLITFLVFRKRLIQAVGSNDDGVAIPAIGALILLVPTVICPFVFCIGDFTKAAVAPRLVIVEHLRSLK